MIPAVGTRIDYHGVPRQVIGHLRYPEPPEPGTLIGPNAWGETCVVLGAADGVTLVGRAIVSDTEAAVTGLLEHGARSVLEHRTGRAMLSHSDASATRSGDTPPTLRPRSPTGR